MWEAKQLGAHSPQVNFLNLNCFMNCESGASEHAGLLQHEVLPVEDCGHALEALLLAHNEALEKDQPCHQTRTAAAHSLAQVRPTVPCGARKYQFYLTGITHHRRRARSPRTGRCTSNTRIMRIPSDVRSSSTSSTSANARSRQRTETTCSIFNLSGAVFRTVQSGILPSC